MSRKNQTPISSSPPLPDLQQSPGATSCTRRIGGRPEPGDEYNSSLPGLVLPQITQKDGDLRSFCTRCGQTHPADWHVEENWLFVRVECPESPGAVLLTEDAALFRELRRNHPAPRKTDARRFWSNHILLTERCDCRCPVCYMDSGPDPDAPFLPISTVLERAERVAKAGGANAVLIGGEPALHPDLVGIVRRIRTETGLKTILATNGLRLAREPQFLERLHAAGLGQLALQFDTLDESTLRAIRGHDRLADKIALARRCGDLGLELGLVCTVCEENIGDLPDLVRWAMALPRLPKYLALQAMTPVGRHTDRPGPMTREVVIRALTEAMPELEIDHFWPVPPLPGLGIFVHPDCCSNAYLLRNGEKLETVDRFLDMGRIISRMGAMRNDSRLPLLRALLAGIRWSRLPKNLPALPAFRHGLMILGVGDFHQPGFLNMDCLDRCATGVVTDDAIVPACRHYAERMESP
jgi:pyruvate-formate lyase-activating enzyme